MNYSPLEFIAAVASLCLVPFNLKPALTLLSLQSEESLLGLGSVILGLRILVRDSPGTPLRPMIVWLFLAFQPSLSSLLLAQIVSLAVIPEVWQRIGRKGFGTGLLVLIASIYLAQRIK